MNRAAAVGNCAGKLRAKVTYYVGGKMLVEKRARKDTSGLSYRKKDDT